MGRVAQSVLRLTTGWTVRDRIPVGTKFSARPDRPWSPPSLLYNGYRVFPGSKVRPGRVARGKFLARSTHYYPIPPPRPASLYS